MARLGLAKDFECVFANDNDAMKCNTYRANFGSEHLKEADIASLTANDLPTADLAWASFPCQDLSLAGNRGGLSSERSGMFWVFWKLMRDLKDLNRAPKAIVVENVTGLLNSKGGKDLDVLVSSLGKAGYSVGATIMDAAEFVPQSRPRLFIIAWEKSLKFSLTHKTGVNPKLIKASDKLSAEALSHWLILDVPQPPKRRKDLVDIIDLDVPASFWRKESDLSKLLSQMTREHKARVDASVACGDRRVGAVYRRVRKGEQRAEIRYDGLAGCIRTLKGGSSRQLFLISEAGRIALRPMLGREAARLMGLPESYVLPKSQTASISLCGDGLCVPAVEWLSTHFLAPLLSQKARIERTDQRIEA